MRRLYPIAPEMPEIDSKCQSAPIRVIFYVIRQRELLILAKYTARGTRVRVKPDVLKKLK